MRREMAEWLVHAMHSEFVLHCFERGGAPEEIQELPAPVRSYDLADAFHDDQVPGDRRHHDQDHEQDPDDQVRLREKMGEAQGLCVTHTPTPLLQNEFDLLQNEFDRHVDRYRMWYAALDEGSELCGTDRAQRRLIERLGAGRRRQRHLAWPAS